MHNAAYREKKMNNNVVNLNNIIETTTILDVKNYITSLNNKALIAIDIDETTLKSAQFFGSSCWSYAYLDYLKKKYNCDKTAFEKTMEKYIYAQMHTQIDPVEGETTREFIEHLHALDHKVIYVTARGPEIAEITEQQLKRNNIKFNHTQEFKNHCVDLTEHIMECHAFNGVIYAHGGDKGLCLEKYLETIAYSQFDHIVAIDDKLSHLQEFSKAARRLGKPFTGFRYGALDHTLLDVNLEIGKVQFMEHLSAQGSKQFLTDDEAKAFLANAQSNYN